MTHEITITEQLRAVELSNRCTRLLSLDMIWSERLTYSGQRSSSSTELANIGREMAKELADIQKDLDFVYALAAEVPDELGIVAQRAIESINAFGGTEVEELYRKADLVESGETPDGDLPRRVWGAIAAVGGFLTIAAGAGAAAVTGPLGVVILPSAAAVGGPLLGAGIAALLQEKKADEAQKREKEGRGKKEGEEEEGEEEKVKK
ncbi:hypothetical protein DY245_07005 [Streptomyces inhibens]|uniref:Uncharacterized protein n=1 Tax=Streptomyces inhibens TaxID=2293571 RepID=A0A371Q8J0_STRIH|nr:hypothetical protein [Streptomyces inhibens]REK91001.1 hypothetical protein DY245_07005 [Streptomyces inhibens]